MPSHDPSRRVGDILASIEKIESYLKIAGGVDRLLEVEDAFHDGVERRLAIISEAAVKLGPLAQELEPSIPWADIRGLGNVLRHNYDGIADSVIRFVLTQHLAPLKAACLRMRERLSSV